MLIIGSVALQHHGITLDREPSDLDIIGTYEEYNLYVKTVGAVQNYPLSGDKMFIKTKNQIIEFEIAWEGSSAEHLLEIIDNKVHSQVYADPYICYLLKMSHRFKKNSPHFHKTMKDINLLREHLNITEPLSIELPYMEWFNHRVRETYDYAHPKLNTSKKDFFNTDGVTYKYDHDSIHEAVKLYDQPAYTYFKPDVNEVFCDKNLFMEQEFNVKLASVIEESMVLAIERSLVPFPDVLCPREAYLMALEKVCTSITSGWWRDWAWEHYHDAADSYNDMFWGKFKFLANNNEVKLYESSI